LRRRPGRRPRESGECLVSVGAVAGGHRARRECRGARCGEDRFRPSRRARIEVVPRPGFVLEVDRSTPPTLFWHGEGFRLERLPSGTRIIYPPEALDPLADADEAVRRALLEPLGSDPLPSLLRPGMKLTIAF